METICCTSVYIHRDIKDNCLCLVQKTKGQKEHPVQPRLLNITAIHLFISKYKVCYFEKGNCRLGFRVMNIIAVVFKL